MHPLWLLARQLLGRCLYTERYPRDKRQLEYRNWLIRECGLSVVNQDNNDPRFRLFEDENAFWDQWTDHDFGSVYLEGAPSRDTKPKYDPFTRELVIHTGWYKWSDGSVRKAPEP